MVARRIYHCNRAAGHDDRTVDRNIGQRHGIRAETLGDVQVSLNRRIGQRAVFRYCHIGGIGFQIRAGVSLAGRGKRRPQIIIQDLRDLAARHNLARLKRAVAVARDKALVRRGLDVSRGPVGHLALVRKRQVGRGNVSRVGLEQTADDDRGLLAGHFTLRLHFIVSRAVDVTIPLRYLDGFIIPGVRRDIRIGNGGRLREMERAVDIPHQLRACHIAVGLIIACCRAGIDHALAVKIFDVAFCPMRLDIGRCESRWEHRDQHGRAQQKRQPSFFHI